MHIFVLIRARKEKTKGPNKKLRRGDAKIAVLTHASTSGTLTDTAGGCK